MRITSLCLSTASMELMRKLLCSNDGTEQQKKNGGTSRKSSALTAQFPCDCKTVWDIVTDNENFEWRSDLSKIKIIDENQNMRGHWGGIFGSCDSGTQIIFTEEVQMKNPIMNLFVKGYLKKQQTKYITDLREVIKKL